MILIDKPLLFQGVLSQCPTAALPHTARAYAHSASRCPMPVWWPTLVPAVEGEDLQTMLVAPGAPPSSWASQPSRFSSLHQERERGEGGAFPTALSSVCAPPLASRFHRSLVRVNSLDHRKASSALFLCFCFFMESVVGFNCAGSTTATA
jgi:hypothetical protein